MTLEIFLTSLVLTAAIFCIATAVHVGDRSPGTAFVLACLGLVNVWTFVEVAVLA